MTIEVVISVSVAKPILTILILEANFHRWNIVLFLNVAWIIFEWASSRWGAWLSYWLHVTIIGDIWLLSLEVSGLRSLLWQRYCLRRDEYVIINRHLWHLRHVHVWLQTLVWSWIRCICPFDAIRLLLWVGQLIDTWSWSILWRHVQTNHLALGTRFRDRVLVGWHYSMNFGVVVRWFLRQYHLDLILQVLILSLWLIAFFAKVIIASFKSIIALKDAFCLALIVFKALNQSIDQLAWSLIICSIIIGTWREV